MKYKFGDIIKNITEKRKPTEEDRLNYIGLEHLDSGSLFVTRWGAERAPEGEKIVMKKGDVLFGKRRAYQKKVAISPIDGVFSAHGMVLRPKENVICKEFLPFFISSDYFLNEAIRISVGGLSPTINWKDIKELEFNLPSIDEQKVLAEKLWAAYEVKQSYLKMIDATQEMVKSQYDEMFGRLKKSNKIVSIFDLIRNGANIKQGIIDDGYPITRIETISEGFVNREKMGYAGIFDDKYKDFYLRDQDILMSHINSLKHIGKVAIYNKQDDETIIHGMNLLCLRPNKELVNPIFVLHMLRSEKFHKKILNITKPAVNQASFSTNDLKNIDIAIPSMEDQKIFANIICQADKSISELRKSIDAINKVIKSLINENL